MILDPAAPRPLPVLDALEAGAADFLAEALTLPPAAWQPLPGAGEHGRGDWLICLLQLELYGGDFPAAAVAANRAACPRSWARLAALPALEVAGFMWLSPGGEIRPHQDHREDNVVRVILGLQLPRTQHGAWPEGAARLLDIRQPHGATNPGDRPRLVLCCDFRLEAPVPEGVIPPWGPTPSG